MNKTNTNLFKKLFPKLTLILSVLFLNSCAKLGCNTNINITSPSGNTMVEFILSNSGEPAYTVKYFNKVIIDTSFLGFKLKDAPPIKGGFKILSSETDSLDETWEQPWGEQRLVQNHYHELTVHLQEKNANQRQMNIVFRVFDDGIGFRYVFPKQEQMKEAVILEENTQFNLTGNHECWWIPGDWDSYEHLYHHTRISEIDALSLPDAGISQSAIMENAVNTPLTMKTADGYYISIHEANLTDYAGMTLIADTTHLIFTSGLVGSERLGYAVKRELPFSTPWRTIQLAKSPGDLISSRIILNLNEPNKLGDVSWVKPAKYDGIWWEMHLNKTAWDMEGGNHGATTENAKRYIDFAAKNNLQAVLVEGWNTGWGNINKTENREGVFDFVTPYADYNLDEVVKYAHDKGIEIIMHHETSAAPLTYMHQMDTAYRLMQKLNLHYAKLGFVGKILPEGEHHHGQWMINNYRHILETAAKYKIALDIHEPIKQTGLRRTYPNLLSEEGLRGQEFNAWSKDGGNPPEHLTIIPFTRMLAGPIDYTPGIFNITLKPYRPNNRVNTTLAQQLALNLIIYSPVQMAADLPENYEGNPAFQFIRDVAVDWEQTKVLDGEIGKYITIARQQRSSDNWFVGTITGKNARKVDLKFDFLDKDKIYNATIYKDGKDADWQTNPTSITIEKKQVTNKSEITIDLARGGGAAISLIPVNIN